MREAGERLDGLDAACAAGARTAMTREAHSLAGAAANVGAATLATLARELEVAAAATDMPALAARVREVRAAGTRAAADLHVILEGGG